MREKIALIDQFDDCDKSDEVTPVDSEAEYDSEEDLEDDRTLLLDRKQHGQLRVLPRRDKLQKYLNRIFIDYRDTRQQFVNWTHGYREKTNQQQRRYIRMSSDVASAAAAAISNENLQLPPLRTLDDFVLGSARFQLPNLKDLEKWGNRVVKNLLYYQTNYFLMFLAIYGLMIVLNPVKISCGLMVQALLIAILLHFFHGKSGSKANFIAKRAAAAAGANESQQKWYFLAGTVLFGYLLLYWFDAVLLTIFTLLLPISLTFVHASLRLRNIKNKMVNTMESFSPSTPMGVFLDSLNISADGILG